MACQVQEAKKKTCITRIKILHFTIPSWEISKN